jgi:hypothetical protein
MAPPCSFVHHRLFDRRCCARRPRVDSMNTRSSKPSCGDRPQSTTPRSPRAMLEVFEPRSAPSRVRALLRTSAFEFDSPTERSSIPLRSRSAHDLSVVPPHPAVARPVLPAAVQSGEQTSYRPNTRILHTNTCIINVYHSCLQRLNHTNGYQYHRQRSPRCPRSLARRSRRIISLLGDVSIPLFDLLFLVSHPSVSGWSAL